MTVKESATPVPAVFWHAGESETERTAAAESGSPSADSAFPSRVGSVNFSVAVPADPRYGPTRTENHSEEQAVETCFPFSGCASKLGGTACDRDSAPYAWAAGYFYLSPPPALYRNRRRTVGPPPPPELYRNRRRAVGPPPPPEYASCRHVTTAAPAAFRHAVKRIAVRSRLQKTVKVSEDHKKFKKTVKSC